MLQCVVVCCTCVCVTVSQCVVALLTAESRKGNMILQYVAVCCSVLQCVAVCCSVLQYVAESREVVERVSCVSLLAHLCLSLDSLDSL